MSFEFKPLEMVKTPMEDMKCYLRARGKFPRVSFEFSALVNSNVREYVVKFNGADITSVEELKGGYARNDDSHIAAKVYLLNFFSTWKHPF